MTLTQTITIKKGLLALAVMYACQLLAGIFVSVVINTDKTMSMEILGLLSALIGGSLILLLFWLDTKKNAALVTESSGLPFNKAISLVLLLLVATHLVAYLYRSFFLPEIGYIDIQGGGSKVFSYIQENSGIIGMVGFLTLALCIGPVMEEVVFRGYLQRSLATKFPIWIAISIASLVFMVGHSPAILWPMYFMFSCAWGYVYMKTGKLSYAILIHVLNNLFYTFIGFSGIKLLA